MWISPAWGVRPLGSLSPFVGGGLGATRVASGETRLTFPKTRTLVPGTRRTALTWRLTAGVGMSWGERATLDLAWRYTDAGVIETGAGPGRRTSSSRNVRNGEASGATPRWRVWPCAGEWHPAFRHAPAHGPGACSCSAASARPVARVPRSRAGSYLWPVREPRRTGGRCPVTAAPGRAPVPGGRAPLRGAALHEAEGRGGARGGGAGRVGPPTGWHRLRLLRQILDELVPGVEQFLLVNNVVAVEDGAALVPGQEHGDPFGDVRADQVARGGAAAIVEEAGGHPSGLTGGAPRRAPAADWDAVAVEDQWAVRVTACPSPVQRVRNGG